MKKYNIFIEDMEGQGSDVFNSLNRIDGTEPTKEEIEEIEKQLGDLGTYLENLKPAIFEIADLYYVNFWYLDDSIEQTEDTPTVAYCIIHNPNSPHNEQIINKYHRDIKQLEKVKI